MARPITFTLLLILVFSGICHSQGDFLKRGESGFETQIGYAKGPEFSGFTGGVGYSINALYDINLSIAKFKNRRVRNLKAFALSPTITLHIKQPVTVRNPYGICLTAGYEWFKYSSYLLDIDGEKMVGEFYKFGATVYRNNAKSRTLTIQPNAAIFYIFGSTKTEYSSGYTSSIDDAGFAYAFGISFLSKTSREKVLRLTPSIVFKDDNKIYGFTMGIIFLV